MSVSPASSVECPILMTDFSGDVSGVGLHRHFPMGMIWKRLPTAGVFSCALSSGPLARLADIISRNSLSSPSFPDHTFILRLPSFPSFPCCSLLYGLLFQVFRRTFHHRSTLVVPVLIDSPFGLSRDFLLN